MNLHKYPFIRLLIPYTIGILVWANLKPASYFYAVAISAFAVMVTMLLNFSFNRSYQYRWVSGLIIGSLFFITGVLNTGFRSTHFLKDHLIHDSVHYDFYYGRVTETAVVKEKSVKLAVDLVAVRGEMGFIKRNASILVYLAREDERKLPEYGHLIRFQKKPALIEGPLNPNQFDYRSYLARKDIFHQVFLQADEWDIEAMGFRNPLFKVAFDLRDFLLKALQKNHIEGDTYGVAAAILLGYDESLPAYLRKGYTAAGAMHVLCVSGLHVGIVFMFFNFLFERLFRKKHKSTLKTIILLALIWFYALLTGLSPSVQRAAIMLSFVLLGRIFNRKGFVLNSIAASALLILVIEPLVLFNIGFQLSYLAVIGIVLLYRPIYGLIYFKHTIPDKVWEVSAVALSAQLMTTPLVLHYFSQFPTYFLVSNLVLVPVSFVVIVSGMIFLIVSFIPFLANLFGWATAGIIWTMNYVIMAIDKWPMAVLDGLYINAMEAVMLLVVAFFLYGILGLKKRAFVVPSLIALLAFLSSAAWRSYTVSNQSIINIYGVSKHTAMHVIQGRTHFMIADSGFMGDTFQIGFNIEKNAVIHGLNTSPQWILPDEPAKCDFMVKDGPVVKAFSRTIVLWSKEIAHKYHVKNPLVADVVLIMGNFNAKPDKLQQWFSPRLIVLDLSVPVYRAEKIKSYAKELGISVHDIREQGAWKWSE